MNCPSCDNTLTRTTYSGANVRQCENCDGILLPKRRAESIQRKIDKDTKRLVAEIVAARHSDLTSDIRCPQCRNKMTKISVQELGFSVDECDNCGMAWFDAGELAQLQLAFESRPQTAELNAMRERLENMTDRERAEYERRIAELPDLGSPMLQAMTAAAFEISKITASYRPGH